MEIDRVSPEVFDAQFPKAISFNRAAFNVMNRDKCEDLHCLLFHDTKTRLGLVAGQRENCLLMPFSAPFGGFVTNDSGIRIEYIEEAVLQLETYAVQSGLDRLEMELPPLFYDTAFLTKVMHVLHHHAWHTHHISLNYFVDLESAAASNHSGMTYSARKHLKTTSNYSFQLRKSTTREDLSLAYDIISENRLGKGYDLSLTKEDVLKTSTLIPMDSFLVQLNGQYVASAIVYLVTPDIPLVVYWGDRPGYESFRTMNFLTHGVIESYRNDGYKKLDTGTAMIDDKPNYGLCAFKESIGCSIMPRCRFVKENLL